MKLPVLCLVLGTLVAKSTTTVLDCTCNDFINKNGYGQCKKSHKSFFNGSALCYVSGSSGCSDKSESKTDPGKWSSAQACQIIAENDYSSSPYQNDAGCICSIYLNINGFGQCLKGDTSVFNGASFCYPMIPSNCSDLEKSKTVPGKWLSAEACTNIISQQTYEETNTAIAQTTRKCPDTETCEIRENCPYVEDKYKEIKATPPGEVRTSLVNHLKNKVCNREMKGFCCKPEGTSVTEDEKFYSLNAARQIVCNQTVHCPPETTDHFTCVSEDKDGEVVHTCRAQVYQYTCDLTQKVCIQSFCTKKCYSGQDYEPHEVINGRQYGCIEGCSDPSIDNCDEDKCPHISGGVVTIDISAIAVQSTSKPSRLTNKCPHGTCKRQNVCCRLQYHPRRRFYVCPHTCPGTH